MTISGFLRAAACLAMLASAGLAHASVFSYTSNAGDVVGGGTGTHTLSSPTATFIGAISTSGDWISIDIQQGDQAWTIGMLSPGIIDRRYPFHRGAYLNAESAGTATARAPGLNVDGVGTCGSEVWGSYKIRQLEFDTEGHLIRLDATFVQRCGSGTGPVLAGTILYDTGPTSFSYSHDDGFPLGPVKARTYYGDTTDLSLVGGLSAFTYGVSGLRDSWYFAFSPPTGKKFATGTYTMLSAADATRAGVYLSEFGSDRCNSPYGSLNVRNIAYAEAGTIAGLYATFTIACTGSPALLRGTIRHGL